MILICFVGFPGFSAEGDQKLMDLPWDGTGDGLDPETIIFVEILSISLWNEATLLSSPTACGCRASLGSESVRLLDVFVRRVQSNRFDGNLID